MTLVKMAMKLVNFVSGVYCVVIKDDILLKYFRFLFNLHVELLHQFWLSVNYQVFYGSDGHGSWGLLYPVT